VPDCGPMRRHTVVASLAVSALLIAGCSAAASSPQRDSSTDVPFTGCDSVACTGTIEGAEYEIVMPETWNGTLLIYSHGYRPAQPFPPTFDPVVTTAVPAPGWDSGDRSLGEELLSRGFAIAGSSYASNGWAVEDGVAAAGQIYDFFSENIATPNRTLVWGDSLGGLITAMLAEQETDWIDGAAPLCGVVAGMVPNIDLAFDVAYAIQQLLYPQMKIADYATYEEAVLAWEGAASRILAGAQEQDPEVIAKILTIAAISDAPSRTRTFDGADLVSQISGTVENLLTVLGYATVGRYDIEQRYGGNVSGNELADYAARVTESEIEAINTVGGGGAAQGFLGILDNGPRVAADPTARAAALERGGNPTGRIQVPVITMHTAYDWVIVQNETFYRDRFDAAAASGLARADLVQTFTVPPPEFSPEQGAPYGAGHCNFTAQSRIAIVELLDRWVREGVYPAQAAIAAAMGPDSGFSPTFAPGPWPAPEAVVPVG